MTDATIIAFPDRAEDRLRLALHRLDEALAEQREAVGAWREEISGLADATTRLDGSLSVFKTNLQFLAVAAREVDDEVKRLGRTADLMASVAR